MLVHALDALISTSCFGSVLFVQTKMVDQLLLDLEGFATLLALVPATHIKGRKTQKTRNGERRAKSKHTV